MKFSTNIFFRSLAFLAVLGLISLFLFWVPTDPSIARVTPALAQHTSSKEHLVANYAKLPLSFEANRGQAHAAVKFMARGPGYGFFLTADEAVVQLRQNDAAKHSATLRMRLSGAQRQPRVSGVDQLPGKQNYFLGNDPKQWQADVPTFGKVKYEAVYPGIDVVYYGNQQQLEYDFVVAAGAQPNQIKLQFNGAEQIRLAENGDLIIQTKAGEVRQHKPVSYQEVNGAKQPVASHYVLDRQNRVGIAVAAYDTTKPLVIDPVLGYATFLGGQSQEIAEGIAVDAAGNTYITGRVEIGAPALTDFPAAPGSLRMTGTPGYHAGMYGFVAKFNATGSALLYSAIFGATAGIPYKNNHGDIRYAATTWPTALALDEAGNAYVTGFTQGTVFPVTAGAIQTQQVLDPVNVLNSSDTFVVKLNPNGSALVYATLFGQGFSSGIGIAVDSQGRAWVHGGTGNPNFPVTANAYQQQMKAPAGNAFVAQLNATGTQLLYATFLGSGSAENPKAIVVDTAGNAYAAGWTGSSCDGRGKPPVAPFPTTEGVYHRDLSEGCVGGFGASEFAYVTKFTPTGTVAYSTLVGLGRLSGIAVDATGNTYLTGKTIRGWDYPITPGAYQPQILGVSQSGEVVQAGFVTKLNATGSGLLYSTYLNGVEGNTDRGPAIAVDSEGSAYLTGTTKGRNFQRQDDTLQLPQGTFVTKLNPTGTAANYATIVGSGFGQGIAVDGVGNAYVTGLVGDFSTVGSLPVTPNAFQRLPGGWFDAFVVKVGNAVPARPVLNVSAASYAGTVLAGDSIVTAFGTGLATTTQTANTTPLPTTLAGTTVKVQDSAGVERAAQLFFVSPTQINYLLPAGLATGAATITVTSGDGTISRANVQIANVAPGLFAADASGRGVAAAVALRVKANGAQSYEPVAQFDTSQNKLVALPLDLGPEGEQVFLILYGTGMRYRSAMTAVGAQLGGVAAQTLFTGAQGSLAGLDQANVRIPRSLAGRGEVDLVLQVDGTTANTVKVRIK